MRDLVDVEAGFPQRDSELVGGVRWSTTKSTHCLTMLPSTPSPWTTATRNPVAGSRLIEVMIGKRIVSAWVVIKVPLT